MVWYKSVLLVSVMALKPNWYYTIPENINTMKVTKRYVSTRRKLLQLVIVSWAVSLGRDRTTNF